jgi:hypothetical protein
MASDFTVTWQFSQREHFFSRYGSNSAPIGQYFYNIDCSSTFLILTGVVGVIANFSIIVLFIVSPHVSRVSCQNKYT